MVFSTCKSQWIYNRIRTQDLVVLLEIPYLKLLYYRKGSWGHYGWVKCHSYGAYQEKNNTGILVWWHHQFPAPAGWSKSKQAFMTFSLLLWICAQVISLWFLWRLCWQASLFQHFNLHICVFIWIATHCQPSEGSSFLSMILECVQITAFPSLSRKAVHEASRGFC